jgi:peptidoglycan/xylan/chitin deacetylase (PgdA/CDA1 family)
MDVGDHTTHHLDLRALSPAELKAETAGSRHKLQKILGHPTYWFAYPYGEFDDQVVAAVRAAGFTMAYTTEGGTTQSTQAPLTMPRLHVSRDTTPSGLIADVGGQ